MSIIILAVITTTMAFLFAETQYAWFIAIGWGLLGILEFISVKMTDTTISGNFWLFKNNPKTKKIHVYLAASITAMIGIGITIHLLLEI